MPKLLACSPVRSHSLFGTQRQATDYQPIENQKTWKSAPLAEDSLHLFPLRCKGQSETIPDAEGNFETVQLGDGIGFDAKRHIVPHGSYLTNMCNPSKEAKDKSYANFVEELKRTEALGIGLFNFQYVACRPFQDHS